jgi:hypothetical protein
MQSLFLVTLMSNMTLDQPIYFISKSNAKSLLDLCTTSMLVQKINNSSIYRYINK